MANYLQLRPHPSAPHILAGVRSFPPSSAPFLPTSAIDSTRNAFTERKTAFRPARRLVLGLGASFWAQSMATSDAFGGKSFLTSARPSSSVEQFQKIKDAIQMHNTERCSIGPPKGVGDLILEPASPWKDKSAGATST